VFREAASLDKKKPALVHPAWENPRDPFYNGETRTIVRAAINSTTSDLKGEAMKPFKTLREATTYLIQKTLNWETASCRKLEREVWDKHLRGHLPRQSFRLAVWNLQRGKPIDHDCGDKYCHLQ